ncbi:RNA polymerase Rpc34 [Hypoxylon fragiforme]|uniref:RNA polymerase Rpc34 n=1 Tax=Hypoxylon fragiforme TaxID=63214 RepID=UPI0020C67281|nr:RNA polymerase Rpc34 [Hypoxylon fragiforme]KAI2604516.1 RNA polymerase Rpc34 [Hypoxylon fragiforme]
MDDKTSILKDQLYAACEEACKDNPDRLFSQEDLTALNVVPAKDVKKLLQIVQILTKERLFAPVHFHSGLAWRLRPEAEAAKYQALTSEDQVLVYEIIDSAGPEGSWQQDIKKRLNLQDNALRKALKELEIKRFINQFTTVENTSKKMWIKYGMQPSARATGGPWYTDQFLDEAFIDALQSVVVNIIKEKGSYRSTAERNVRSVSPVLPKKGVIRGGLSDAAIKSKKRSADAISKDDPPSTSSTTSKFRGAVRLPLIAGYTGYPTAQEITADIVKMNVAKGQPLKTEHVQELIDILVWESRIEEVKMGDRVGYRAVRVSKHNPDIVKLDSEDFWEARTNGLTTVPCGKCPVFELCEEGGPVWAGGCEYFDKWLA